MKHLILPITILCSVMMTLTGCSTLKKSVGDNSLTYTQTQKLAPIQLPADAQTLAFTPLYHVPDVGTNTLQLKNEQGKRFELPKPVATVK